MLTKFATAEPALTGYSPVEFFDNRATREIVQRHLLNRDDRITEEDIKMVKTEMSVREGAGIRKKAGDDGYSR